MGAKYLYKRGLADQVHALIGQRGLAQEFGALVCAQGMAGGRAHCCGPTIAIGQTFMRISVL